MAASTSNGASGKAKPIRSHKDSNSLHMQPPGQHDSTPRDYREDSRYLENHSSMDGHVLKGSMPQLTESPAAGGCDNWSSNYRAISNLSKTNSNGRHVP